MDKTASTVPKNELYTKFINLFGLAFLHFVCILLGRSHIYVRERPADRIHTYTLDIEYRIYCYNCFGHTQIQWGTQRNTNNDSNDEDDDNGSLIILI